MAITLNADADKVYCNGYTKTQLGGIVNLPDTADPNDWQQMTEEAADLLIAENTETEEEATEADYIAALDKLGVDLNEEV